jgi:cell wall-associated NlpC family hydrolase
MGRDMFGLDCWGLVYLVYKQELEINLPDYVSDYSSPEELREIGALIAQEKQTGWHRVCKNDIRPFDVALFRRGRFDAHVGVMIDNTRMLHMARDQRAVIEALDRTSWMPRLQGYYCRTETKDDRS